MNKLKTINYLILLFILLPNAAFSQDADTNKAKLVLENEILKMDNLLFNVAFNQCDLVLYKKIMSPNLEFYDDRTGLNTSFAVEVASFKDRCSIPVSTTRKLVSSTVHVLGDYGAVQLGEHEFYVDDEKVEKAQFIIVWERQDDSWIVKRTISYDHKPVLN